VKEELFVVIGSRLAGQITRARGRVELTYDDAYRQARGATPLSVSMPLQEPTHRHIVLAPWLDGLLPDSAAVRRRWGRQFSVSADSPFSLLSTPVGEECAGAARFVTAERLDAALAGEGDVTWLSEADVAERIRALHEDSSAWLGVDFTGRFSLAGAQAKTALLYDEVNGRWGIPTGAAATSHILKPAITGLDDHDLNEHVCLRAAGAAGLLCAPTRLVRFEDQNAVTATRYDRVSRGGRWLARVHQEDMCQALGLPPERKYQNEGGPSTRDISALLRRVLRLDQAEAGVWRFFDAVALNWLIAGTDAHAKNYSLLLSGQQVALAPLYDIASALPYRAMPTHRLRLAMKFGAEYTLDTRSSTVWPRVAADFGLPVEEVRVRASALMDVLPDAFKDASADPTVAEVESPLPGRLVDAVAARVKQCRLALGGSRH
jgi:serine/threonine-protein kinase HipA